MNIVVCVKIVQGEINPFDAAALETALRQNGAQITVVCMGPQKNLSAIQGLTRLGNFRTIFISDALYAGSDTLATSRVLATALKEFGPSLIFCGRQSIDGETAQVGPCLATMLGFPFFGHVMEFTPPECRTRYGVEKITIPSILAFERICQLRFPSLKSIVRDVEVWDNRRLKIDPARCGLAGSPTRVLETFPQEHGRRNCRFLGVSDLEPLLENLRRKSVRTPDETKMPGSKHRIKTVWAVGSEVRAIADRIGEKIVEWNDEPIETLVERARRERPGVILWNADHRGRITAPKVAALLETGLCADCTQLSVFVEDGGAQLEMYRPALGGNVMARIRCRTRPVMATVRTAKETRGLVVSCGKGAAHCFGEASLFAQRHQAELCVSRGLVDLGVAAYEMQVGLTGKHVSPEIYLALGISGTVQHLCAVENAGTIIAVNSDKKARIFEYADFGIVERLENLFQAKGLGKPPSATPRRGT